MKKLLLQEPRADPRSPVQTPGAVGQSASWPSGIKGDVNQALVLLGLVLHYISSFH